MNNSNNSSEGYITLIQHNANRSDIAHHTVLQQSFERSTDILLLQEPYSPCFDGLYTALQHPAYDLIIPLSNTAPSSIPIRPRVLAYVRKASNLTFTPRYDLFNDPDIQAIEIIGLETFLIFNIYNERERDYGEDMSQCPSRQGQYTVDRLLLHTQLQEPTLLTGDFNLHHDRWNSAASAANIEKASNLVSWLDSQQATLAIDPEITNEKGGTFHRSNLRNISIIDLTFYTPFSKLAWSGWRFVEGSGSDHEVIAFEARPIQPLANSSLFNSRPPLFNYKLADWDRYSTLLRQKETALTRQIHNLIVLKDYDSIATTVTNAILESAEASIPRLRPCERSKPWWNSELTSLRKTLNKALRQYKKYKTGQLEEEYKAAKNTYFQSVRQAKRAHWDNFLQNAMKDDIFKAYTYTKKTCYSSAIPSINYTREGRKETAKTFQQKCEAFLTTLFPTSSDTPTSSSIPNSGDLASSPQNQNLQSPGQYEPSIKDASRKGNKGYSWDWPDLEDKEVKEAIFSFKKTAPGPDTIGSFLIQKTYQVAPSILNSAYKALFAKGYHPAAWRSSIGIILPKNGDREASDPGSYRVIALLNSLGKVLEKVYATRLSHLANTTELLHGSQLGGRKQRSTIDAALLLVQHIEEQRLLRKAPSKTITSTIFLDIKGGFDHVSREKLIRVLERLCLPKTLISWVASFLCDRSTRLAFSGQMQQQSADLPIGIPQGSPISPILFLIYIKDIIADEAFQLSYIDDFSLSVSSTSARKNCKAIEKIVANFIEVAREQGVSFNPKKTELIHFTTQREPIAEGVTIDGQAVAPKLLVKWLGIWFDYKLSFKQHIERRINLAMASFLGMQRLAGTQKGLSFRAMRQLYIACVTTVADYGVPVWYRGPRQGRLLQLYQRLQNQALPKILGAFGKSPIKAMELEAAIPPPEIRFQKACLGYGLRTLYFQRNHPIRLAYNRAVRDELADSNSDLGTITFIKPTTQLYSLLDRLKAVVGPNWNIERQKSVWKAPWTKAPIATINMSEGGKEKAKQEHLDLLETLVFKDCSVFYTDGSQGVCKGVRTNSCSYCEIEDERPKVVKYWNLGTCIEVADAELIAIYKVLKALQRRSYSSKHEAYIFIDSQAAIQKVSGYSDIAAKIRVQLQQLRANKITVTLAWCPSHTGVSGNELADSLAKKGLEAEQIEPTYVSLSYLRRKIKEACLSNWKRLWEQEEEREVVGSKARGLGNHYRKVVRGNVRFAYKPNVPTGPRAAQSAFVQLKLGIGFLKKYQKLIGTTRSNKCPCGQIHTTSHLLQFCKRYNVERRKMEKALGLGQPLTLQMLFGTKTGREALIGFLASTKICTAKWFEDE